MKEILQLIGFPTIISAIVLSVYNRWIKKKDVCQIQLDKIDNIEETISDINQEIIDIRNKELEDAKAIKNLINGQQALLRDRIVAQYNKYIEKGYMPIYAKESLDHMYASYKELGGNGVIDSLMDTLYSLPTELLSAQLNSKD